MSTQIPGRLPRIEDAERRARPALASPAVDAVAGEGSTPSGTSSPCGTVERGPAAPERAERGLRWTLAGLVLLCLGWKFYAVLRADPRLFRDSADYGLDVGFLSPGYGTVSLVGTGPHHVAVRLPVVPFVFRALGRDAENRGRAGVARRSELGGARVGVGAALLLITCRIRRRRCGPGLQHDRDCRNVGCTPAFRVSFNLTLCPLDRGVHQGLRSAESRGSLLQSASPPFGCSLGIPTLTCLASPRSLSDS